ncbi:helix-turn-helix protein [Aneurinibacillus soli]|uniref:Uncharacterized protein n=1 Tax=Aneurinibacillus soli TaxID=1500254 RepID=A0A0U4WML3_9BACL|nr:helix-turn-helix domain-containing protein [Aneurinibacillus soli]PYE59140.1 helix-turn-helix protein [Aneurinibacillus soli]BAU29560.1 hypothetical protein CB4_03760 [Aneurinibacillus soli]
MNTLDLLLHPVRMRILQTLMPDRELTVQEIGEHLSDIPPATLYRHVKKLKEGGVIESRSRQQIRGTVESRYGITSSAFQGDSQAFNQLPAEEHLRYFSVFLSFLQAEFGRYLTQPERDFEKDGIGYRYTSVYLSEDEFNDWLEEYRTLMRRAMALPPAPHRMKRTLAHIFLSEKE